VYQQGYAKQAMIGFFGLLTAPSAAAGENKCLSLRGSKSYRVLRFKDADKIIKAGEWS